MSIFRWKNWWLVGAVFYTVILVVLMLIPGSEMKKYYPEWHDFLHIPAYGVLAYLWYLGLKWMKYRVAVGWLILGLFGFSVCVELLQGLVGRTISTFDLTLNFLGIVLFVFGFEGVRLLHKRARVVVSVEKEVIQK